MIHSPAKVNLLENVCHPANQCQNSKLKLIVIQNWNI